MAFFVRSKKVKKKKNAPAVPAEKQTKMPSHHPPLPQPPSQASQCRQVSPSQRSFSPPSAPGGGGRPQYQQTCPPVIVNQHYYLGTPPYTQVVQSPHAGGTCLRKLNLGSAVDLAKDLCQGTCIPRLLDDALPLWHDCGSQLISHGNALIDQISDRFDNVLTVIDQGGYDGEEHDISSWQPAQRPALPPRPSAPTAAAAAAAAAAVSEGVFAKVDLYANSKLPMNLPPLKLYIPTYPLLCLAAQYSEHVYSKPKCAERDVHVDADWRTGTKAMVIKSVPMDTMNTIVFAIRGTASFMDWAVNLKMAPASPAGFLDDPGNLCHAGFLSVARKMVAPVAARLRQLLEEDPGRASYSLLITGHSAGGAVAALLYCHMLSTSKAAESELTLIAGCFKRIHCITFGTPPVSLMPLDKPDDPRRRRLLRKSLFLSFVNEGDPVPRADKAYVKSLLELYAAPPPPRTTAESMTAAPADRSGKKSRRGRKAFGAASGSSASFSFFSSSSSSSSGAKPTSPPPPPPVWKVPPCTLSCAGRLVVLRSGDPRARHSGRKTTVEERLREGVVAQVVTDEQLRGVVWGDPVAHMMKLYAGRIETLAVGAVTGRGY